MYRVRELLLHGSLHIELFTDRAYEVARLLEVVIPPQLEA